jgi:hypothetical protein
LGETRFPVDDSSVAGMVRQLLPLTEDDLYDLLARQDLATTQVAGAVVRAPLDVAFIDLGTISLPGRAELVDRGRSLFRKYNALAYELICGECSENTPHRERIEHAREGIGVGLEVLGGLLGSALEAQGLLALPAAIVAVLVVKQGHRLVCAQWRRILPAAQ